MRKPAGPLSAVAADTDPRRAVATVTALMRIGLLEMNRIQEPFIRIKNTYGRTPKRRLLECGEKAGKTMIGIAEAIAHAMGFRPWLDQDDPDYKILVRVPNQGLIGCMTMAQSVSGKIEPDLESLIPPHCAPVWKRDTTGALKSVTLRYDYRGKPCGSTIHIRSYNQLPETFLGIDYDWYAWDEPPPEKVLIAAERGKVASNAPSWFTMTPLSEPYIYDRFSVKAFNNGGTDPEVATFRGSMWDNCQDYCRACDLAIPQNDPAIMPDPLAERPVHRCPRCGQVMGFMARAGILEYLKVLADPDEIAAHIEGKWAHLSGLVYKELDRAIHTYPDFPIPRDWMRVEAVDPHDARPTRWLFGAVSPEEIVINGAPANRLYVYSYLLANGNIDEIVRQVKVRRAEHNYRTPALVVLDAKFGAKTVKTFETTTSWEEELGRAGITHIVLSSSDPGDLALGHKRVKEYLRPHFSVLQNAAFPGLLFAADGCRGDRGPLQDMSNYQWKPGTDRPEEAYKDFCDCYDSETEVLAESGWKKFTALSPPEKVATLNLSDNHLEFQQPTDYIHKSYSGPMVSIQGRSVDLLVTPNHKMLYTNGGGIEYPKRHWRFRTAATASPWDVIPLSSAGRKNDAGTHSDWDFEFMGWYIAEGCATGTRGGKIQLPGRGYSVYVSQTECSPVMPRLRAVMENGPYHARYDGRSFVISNKALWEQVFPLGNSHEKYLPDWVFEGSRSQLLKLWDAYVMGDGWTGANDIAATVSLRLATDMQRLLSLAGFSSSIRERIPSSSRIRGRDVLAENCSKQYYICKKTGDVAHLCRGDKTPIFSTVDYAGDIYCVTVPNHTLLVRRNHTPVFCGNCVRYLALEQPVYRTPSFEDDELVSRLVAAQAKAERDYRPMSYGLRVRGC